MSIANSTAVVLGATGNVGWGAAKAFLKHGARVVAVSRNVEQARELPEQLVAPERVVGIAADMSTPEGAKALADALKERGIAVDHVFASMGPWWQKGPVVEQSGEEFRKVMRDSFDCHVFAAQALIPLIRHRAGASYTLVTGQGGHANIPGTGLLVIALGGVFALSRVLRAEHASEAVRVNELLIRARIEKAPRRGVVPSERFGEAATAIAGSEVRGQILPYDSPEQFAADLRG